MKDFLEALIWSPGFLIGVVIVLLGLVVLVLLGRLEKARNAASYTPLDSNDGGDLDYRPDAAGGSTGAAEAPHGGGVHLLDLRGPPPHAALKTTFRRVDELTRRSEGGALPWFLCIGAAGAGKSTLLGHSDLRLPYGEPRSPAPGETPAACQVWIFDRAVMLDVEGDLILPQAGVSADRAGWSALLHALRDERPKRPADGILLALPAPDLMAAASGDPTALRLLGRRADRIRSRLEEAQSTLSFDLPVSVVVSKTDLVRGVPDLLASLPADQLEQIFGWSVPYPPTTAYSGSWPDDAVAAVVQFLEDQQAQALAAAKPLSDPQAYLALPATFEALRSPLRTVLNRIFAGGPGPGTPPFRGLYWTAGSGFSTSPAVSAGGSATPAGPAREEDPSTSSSLRDSHSAEVAHSEEVAGESGGAHQQVDFVTDLLAEKVFSDWDLARPEPTAVERRERLLLWTRIALAVLLLLAPVALLVYDVHLSHEASALENGFTLPAVQAMNACRPESVPVSVGLCGSGPAGSASPLPTAESPAAAASRAATVGTAPHGDPRPCVPQSLSLLDAAAAVPDYRLRPGSWVNDLTQCVSDLAIQAYEIVVFPTLYSLLNIRAHRVADEPVPTLQSQSQRVYDLPTVDAFNTLRSMMQDLDQLEDQVGYYNRFYGEETCWTSTEDAVDYFDQLTRYLLRHPFSPPTHDAEDFYGQILCDSRPQFYDPSSHIQEIDTTVEQMSGRMFQVLYKHNAIVLDLADLTREINRLSSDPPSPVEADARYAALVDLINQTEADLADPRMAWAGSDTPAFGAAYQALLTSITSSRWTGIDTARQVHQQARTGLPVMREGLKLAATSATGPLLARKGDEVQLRLAPSVLSLRAALATLLGQYLRPIGELGWKVVPARGTYLSWNPVQLNAAADLMDGYDTFVETQLQAFPSLASSFDQSTRDRVEREALATAARGQKFPPSPSLGSGPEIADHLAQRVGNLEDVGEPLNRLATDFRKPTYPETCTANFQSTNLQTPYCLFAQTLAVQEVSLLTLLDELLLTDALYTPVNNGFVGWDGRDNLAWSAFGVSSAKELEGYVTTQRNTLSQRNDAFATPILTTVPVPSSILPSPPEPVVRWELIRSDLAAYQAKTAGNALGSLETFILDEMAGATLPACLDLDPAATSCLPTSAQGRVASPPCDYFLASRNRLLLASAATCETVTLTAGGAAYGAIAERFTSDLAGRYPFAEAPSPTASSGAGAEATPAGIAGFYTLYDAARPAVERALTVTTDLEARQPGSLSTGFGIPWPEPTWSASQAASVDRFLTDLDGVRTFFNPFLTAWAAAGDKPKPAPQFGLAVDLRPVPASETAGNQVVRRSLSMNGDLARAAGPPPAPVAAPLVWTYGSALQVTLEWAQDGWYQPRSVGGDPYGTIRSSQATYDYPAPWSLLHLAQARATCPPAPPGESGPPRPDPTLGDLAAYCVTTERTPPPAPLEPPRRWSRPETPDPGSAPEEPTRAVLYVQVVPQTATDPQVAVAVPSFPSAAPRVPLPAVPSTTAPLPVSPGPVTPTVPGETTADLPPHTASPILSPSNSLSPPDAGKGR